MSAPDRSDDSVRKVFEAIQIVLALAPDLRVGQIIDNAVYYRNTKGHGPDTFYIENEDLATAIIEFSADALALVRK